MPQSLARVLLHLVYSTKHREPSIPASLQGQMHRYLGGIASRIGCTPVQIGGTADHVHLLLALGRTITIADAVMELKTGSSQWMKGERAGEFSWQAGYGAFSVSESKAPGLVDYIRKQPDHHVHRSFQEEYREFLIRHGVSFDERYVWD